MINVAVIGYGYWGPRVARNFHSSGQTKLSAICDERPESLARARADFPDVTLTGDAHDILSSKSIDAVAIVTPVWTHFEFAKLALENGKHVWVEKPFTLCADQAVELIELAERKHLTIMVDHTFLFTGAVKKIGELIDDQTLGNLYYYDSTRVNLGLFQHDVNVVWDLAPHDISIMDFLIREEPEAVVATGQSHLNDLEDMAYITVFYPHNLIAHVSVNWLSPVKVRTTLVGGEKKMLVWNDLEADEKIRVYDKGVDVKSNSGLYDLLVSYRSGDMWAPKVDQTEALKSEARYFAECIANGIKPINDGIAGHRVVRLLEAATISLKNRGKIVSM
ncbi:MAG: Gfo/Idh/MocA family oxidoreductase [Terracidiphilus sp.]|jgi:predicted dehydrogenase